MTRKISACIFDMDGVLVHTEMHHFFAWKRLAKTLGFTIDEEFNEKLKGVSRTVCIDLILEHGGIQKTQHEKNKLAEQKNKWFLESVSSINENDVLPGVIDFLQDLRKNSYKMAVGSASKNAPLLLEKMGITSFFDAIIDGNKIQNAKPHPEVFLRAAQELAIDPFECVVFEDAQSGVEAAKTAGMFCVGVGDPVVLFKADVCIQNFVDMNLLKLHKLLDIA